MTMTNSLHQNAGGTNVRDGLLYFLVGGGIGAVVALLFAPKPGVELRGNISEITRKGYDESLEVAQNLRQRSEEFYQSIKDKADKAYDLAATRLSLGRDKSEDLLELPSDVVSGESDRSAKFSSTKGSGPTRRAANIF